MHSIDSHGVCRASGWPRHALALATASVCLAAQAADESTAPLAEVTVRAKAEQALPQATGVVQGGLLARQQSASSDTAQLLQDVPGVTLYGAGGLSSLPAIRGLADDRLRIQLDGMDLVSACGNHMNPPLSYIAPQAVRQVQVLAGITPVSNGGDSIGGSVLVSSEPARFAPAGDAPLLGGELGAYYRSNGNVQGGHVGAYWASDAFSLNYRADTVQASNYHAAEGFKPAGLAAAGRGWLDADVVGSSAYESLNQALSMAWRQGQHQWELKVGLQSLPYQGFANQRMDMTGNDSEQVNLRYQGRYDWGKLEAQLYHEHTRHAMQFGDDKLYWYPNGTPGTVAGMPMDTEGHNTGVNLKADVVLNERDLLRVGAGWQRYRLNDWWLPSGGMMMAPNTFWNINAGKRDRLALFGEWEARWSPRWLTLLGLRHEQVDMNADAVQGYNAMYSADANAFNAAARQQRDHNLDLVALARFEPDAEQRYEFGYAMKTRSPNLYERYAWSTNGMAMRMVNLAGDGNGYVGNLQLAPETAHTLSATADWHDAAEQRWGLRFTPYVTQVDGYIDAQRCSGGTGMSACTSANLSVQDGFVYLQYLNQSARLYGWDLSGHTVLADATPLGRLSARGVLSYQRGHNRVTGDALYHLMPLNARLALEAQQGRWQGALESELVSAKDRVNHERNEVPTQGYALVHLRASYTVDQLRLDFGVENLFNRFYQHPLGGAYLGQGATMSGTSVAWGTAVPGPGRTFYAGVNLKF